MANSDQINELAAALSKAQAMGLIAVKNSKNSHTNSEYANLIAVCECVRVPMAENGLSVSFLPGTMRMDAGKAYATLVTMLMHTSGQWIQSVMEIPVVLEHKMLNPAQCFGLVFSYARRYALCGIMNVVTGDDDDAQRAWSETKNTPESAAPSINATWQELYDSGKWKEFPAANGEMGNMGDLTATELKACIKADLANGGFNACVTAAAATLLVGAARERAASLPAALEAAGWKATKNIAEFTAKDIKDAYNVVVSLPKLEPKGGQ